MSELFEALKQVAPPGSKYAREYPTKNMDDAPWNREVLLFGESGYNAPHDRFIINGYRIKDWHGGEWNNACGDRLSDNGWIPTYWEELER